MPFDADLRAGYFKIEFNMSWFYEALSDAEVEVEFHTLTDGVEQYNVKAFERFIEDCAYKFIVSKIFKHDIDDTPKNYDCIWQYLTEQALEFEAQHPTYLTIHADKYAESDSE